jgi:hypothetical protein
MKPSMGPVLQFSVSPARLAVDTVTYSHNIMDASEITPAKLTGA